MTFPWAKLLLFLSFVVSLCSLVVALNPAVVADEAALLDFKSFVTSDPSGILSEWDPAVRDHCEWQGVTCNTSSGRVSRLELAVNLDSPLAGILSANLGNLTELRILVLRQNSFYGEIPSAAIGRLRLLETLDLSGNNFSGRIPDDIGKLPSLSVLDLAHNFLDGPVMIGLIGHAPLKYLDLSFNCLSGGININPLGDCTSLNHLKLSSNLLAGEIPHDIGKCSNLRVLLLDDNSLQGSIPAELGKIAELRILDVSKNSLTGRIPKELGDCRQLVALILTNLIGSSIADISSPFALRTTEEFNAFDGAIPAEVFSLPSLEILWAPRANLGGGLHDFFNPSCTLKILNLGQNYFNGSIPELLGSCVNLTYLDLSLNNLQGSIPVSLAVQCMAYFNVSRNLLSGPLIGLAGKSCTAIFSPVHLSWGLLKLEDDLLKNYYANLLQIAQERNPFGKVPVGNFLVLHDLSWNDFSGSLPYLMVSTGELLSYGLLLNNNGLNGSIPNDFLKSCKGVGGFAINLSCNQLSGEIGAISDCFVMKRFEAANNDFSGPIPSDITNLLSLSHIDLTGNHLNGTLTNQLGRLTLMETVLLGRNDLSGSIPAELGAVSSLKHLDLSWNSLDGSIPPSLADVTKLEMLLLDHNRLSGQIPSSFSKLPNLAMLNVSFNNLSGEIPHLLHATNCEFFKGNQFLGPCPESNSSSHSGFPTNMAVPSSNVPRKKLKYFMVASIASGTFIIGVFLLIIFLVKRRKIFAKPNDTDLMCNALVTFTDTPAELTCNNILRATGNFSVQNLIGTGGFGATYRAELLPGYLVAVKRLYIGKFQGFQQFDAEIRTLGQIRHKNLVTLVGYHMGEVDTFLIYNYLSGGNLETFIQNMSQRDICWPVIYKIVLDVALAISYLHYSCVPRIVHRDIKPSNILLDGKFNAYLSDFGLARLLQPSQTHATTNVAGTFGYVAPEYATTCKVSDKADVYSFGVVLLELLSGRRSLDPSFFDYGDGFNIVAWARLLIEEERFGELFHPSLWGAGPRSKLLATLRLALACTVESLSVRPSIKQAMEILQKLKF